ncbi:MAG: hypothetical protein DI535_11100 [Citrobacter freundii]|nr:MAG: hypothetical protein DI535_11100 [Citrobacter freundii]
MKKFFLAAIILTAGVVSAFANPVEKDPKAEETFSRQFSGAQNITWSRTEDGVLKVSFVWGGHSSVAYFNEKSELVASARNMFFDQLPMAVVRSVESKFKSPVVTEVRELYTDEGTSYNLVLEEGTKKFKVKLNSMGDILTKDRLKK